MEVVMQVSDHELVKKCLEGCQDSFAELMARYKRLIYTVVYNLLKDRDEADDLSQEVFIRIYKSLGTYNPQYKFSTWSVRVATNLCLDFLRKRKVNSIPIEEIENISRDDESPEDKYVRKERSIEVKRAIAGLPEQYRTPIILFHQKGATYKEIADILNQPMSIIKNRLYRARLMLRENIAGSAAR